MIKGARRVDECEFIFLRFFSPYTLFPDRRTKLRYGLRLRPLASRGAWVVAPHVTHKGTYIHTHTCMHKLDCLATAVEFRCGGVASEVKVAAWQPQNHQSPTKQ